MPTPLIPFHSAIRLGDVAFQQAGFEYMVLGHDSLSKNFRQGVKLVGDVIILLSSAQEEDVSRTLYLAEYYDTRGELGRVVICFNLVSTVRDDIEAAR